MECEIFDMPLFRGGDRTIMESALQLSPGRYATYRKGDFIALQNDVCRSLLLLCEGSVYAQMTSEEGRELTLDTLTAPDTLASAFVFASETAIRSRSSPMPTAASGSSAASVCGRSSNRTPSYCATF